MTTMMDEFGIEALRTSGKLQIPRTRKEKLQAELQLLEWHKMANAAAIKGALLQTKSLKQQTREQPKVAPFQVEEDSKWIKRVIQQEHIKPLEVSRDFVLDYERKEKENADRLSHQVDRHISTLKQLRMKLEARHDLKTRTEEYRSWQKEFLPKKHAVMIGKTLEEIEVKSPATNQQEIDEINDELMNKTLNKGNATQSQELSNVLDSLSKLADLEKRITSLEKENKYDQLVAAESPTANQRTQFEFRKKRDQIAAITKDNTVMGKKGAGPMGMVYEVRQKKAPVHTQQHKWKVNLPSGGGAQAVKAKRSRHYDADEYENDFVEHDNVFITAQRSDASLAREQQRKERMRMREMAPAGAKALKNRITTRKARQKEQSLGARKHEDAMREMARRKADQLKKKDSAQYRQPIQKVIVPNKGMASGVRTKNKHLQDFHKAKSDFNKRRDELSKPRAAQASSRRVPGGVESRLQSQTVPIYASKNPRASRQVAAAPKTGVTRRTGPHLPTRRPNQPPPSSSLSNNHQSIAVTGVRGLGVLRGSNKR